MTAFESSGLLDPARTDDIARIAQQFAAIHQSKQASLPGTSAGDGKPETLSG
jgi:hypothetical protein